MNVFNRVNKWSIGAVIIVILMAIGLVVGLLSNPLQLLLPIVIIGGIFLLYKFPPGSLRGHSGSSRQQTRVIPSRSAAGKPKHNRPKSKTVPFRVIEGGKDDDDVPKYH
ncbi:hypothetical protein D3P08_07985 [Paenibacillus nanensis]|uniref:DUF2207 domain-containing protein n=1 Tax=Paenibacillus nanensis TaxID=393251 RepID=A0A3A1V300_9BACL|nr:hypothetical protein D3P08_07985 [Paenibacillus nanensis]